MIVLILNMQSNTKQTEWDLKPEVTKKKKMSKPSDFNQVFLHKELVLHLTVDSSCDSIF